MKYSKNFERDYNWYLKYKNIFDFSGSIYNFSIDLENGKSAKECFYIYDNSGNIIPTNEPFLLQEILNCKKSINLHIKMWVDSLAEGTLFESDIEDLKQEFELLPWMVNAIKNQKTKVKLIGKI
jgi:hypothetical protein